MLVSKTLKLLGAASILVLGAGGTALAAGAVHWGYDSDKSDGPADWGQLKDSHGDLAFADCNGIKQSPIDIDATVDGADVSISFSLDDTPLRVKNNGHSIQVDYAPGSATTIDGVEWPLAQFHFHTFSEQKIKGKLLPAEAHLVHLGAGPTFAVVGVLFEEGAANPVLQKMLDVLEAGKTGHYEPGVFPGPSGSTINPAGLLPKVQGLHTYSGSFTTPPCTEGVNWNVMQETMTVSREQVERFREILEDVGHFPTNNRPVLPLNDRAVSAKAAN